MVESDPSVKVYGRRRSRHKRQKTTTTRTTTTDAKLFFILINMHLSVMLAYFTCYFFICMSSYHGYLHRLLVLLMGLIDN